MKNKNQLLMVSSMLLVLASTVLQAEEYTNTPSDGPFDVRLDTGAGFSNESVHTSSVSSSNTGEFTRVTTPVLLDPVITPAGPGVAGSIDIYTQSFSRDYSYESAEQNARINYNPGRLDSLNNLDYTLNGSINFNGSESLIGDSNPEFYFGMGMNLTFDEGYTSNSSIGSLTFLVGNDPDSWSYSRTMIFDDSVSTFGSIHHDFSLQDNIYGMNFEEDVFFSAIFSVDGSNVPFDMSYMFLDVLVELETNSTTLLNETSINTLISHVDIPAGPVVVPVPAAVWLFASGLLTLIGFTGRRKTR